MPTDTEQSQTDEDGVRHFALISQTDSEGKDDLETAEESIDFPEVQLIESAGPYEPQSVEESTN